jgi:hypothetical protein
MARELLKRYVRTTPFNPYNRLYKAYNHVHIVCVCVRAMPVRLGQSGTGSDWGSLLADCAADKAAGLAGLFDRKEQLVFSSHFRVGPSGHRSIWEEHYSSFRNRNGLARQSAT